VNLPRAPAGPPRAGRGSRSGPVSRVPDGRGSHAARDRAVAAQRGPRYRGTVRGGVFDLSTNRLVTPGVNLVAAINLSTAHAEIMAIMIAQQIVGHSDLGGRGRPPTSRSPARSRAPSARGRSLGWGVPALCVRGQGRDARDIGFDEGPKVPGWVSSMERRGIIVVRDVCCDEVAAELKECAKSEGKIYNAHQESDEDAFSAG
jgi:hypothetical protein